ncbi:protein of unknown function (plasmid) [Caballeronia sp. S22]
MFLWREGGVHLLDTAQFDLSRTYIIIAGLVLFLTGQGLANAVWRAECQAYTRANDPLAAD